MEREITIPHNMDATEAYYTIINLLDLFGVEYDESGEETIIIRFNYNKE